MLADILLENLNPESCTTLCAINVLCLGLDPPRALLVLHKNRRHDFSKYFRFYIDWKGDD